MGHAAHSTSRIFTASSFSIAIFYVLSQRELFPNNWKKSIFYLPLLMALGIGLTVTNTKAVMEALFGIQECLCAHAEIQRDKKR